MDWIQVLSIIAANIAFLAYFTNRIEGQIIKFEGRLNSHAARIDQLYQMFVDLLKNKK